MWLHEFKLTLLDGYWLATLEEKFFNPHCVVVQSTCSTQPM